jgi:flagellar biogenesis protein FliO
VVRRIVEEDVTTPSTTVVESDGSWVGRTLVSLVVIALLVVGAIWLFNNVGDNDNNGGRDKNINVDVNDNTDGGNTDTNTEPAPVNS